MSKFILLTCFFLFACAGEHVNPNLTIKEDNRQKEESKSSQVLTENAIEIDFDNPTKMESLDLSSSQGQCRRRWSASLGLDTTASSKHECLKKCLVDGVGFAILKAFRNGQISMYVCDYYAPRGRSGGGQVFAMYR